MADMVESMAWAGEVPWHGLGVRVSPDLSPHEILMAAKLDWEVKMIPLHAEFDGAFKKVPGQYGLQRQTDGKILSVTSEKYRPVQNEVAMDFFTKFCKAGHMKMETAGSLDQGKFIWALAKINKTFILPGQDEMLAYLLLMQPHKVGHAMVIDFTSIRVVCWNTLNAALGSHLKGSAKAFRMPHLQEFNEDMKTKAEIALGLATHQFEYLQEAAQLLSKVKIPNADALQLYFDNVIGFDRPKEGNDNEPRVMNQLRYAYDAGPGSNMASASGTYWGAVNAVTYVVDHHSGRMDDTRLKGAWLGNGSVRKRKALEIAVEFAKAA